MTLRTIHKDVTFRHPFNLAGLDEVFPAGVYATETEEVLLEGLSFTAFRRVTTIIHLQPKSTNPAIKRSMTIEQSELDAALLRDSIATDLNPSGDVVAAEQYENFVEFPELER